MRGLVLRRRSLWILTLQCVAAFFLLSLRPISLYASGAIGLGQLLESVRGAALGVLLVPWLLCVLFEDRGRFLVEEARRSLIFYTVVCAASFVGLAADAAFFSYFLCFILASYAALSTVRYLDNLDVALRLEEDARDETYLGVTLPHLVALVACALAPSRGLGALVMGAWLASLAIYVAVEVASLVRLGTAAPGGRAAAIEEVTAVEDVAWQRSRLRGPTSDAAARLLELASERAPSHEELAEALRALPLSRSERRLAFVRERFGPHAASRQEARLERQLVSEALSVPSRVPCLVLALAGLGMGLGDMCRFLSAATGKNYYQLFSRLRERLADEGGALYWLKGDLFSELSEGRVAASDGARALSRLLLLRLAREAGEADDLGEAIERFRSDVGVMLDEHRSI